MNDHHEQHCSHTRRTPEVLAVLAAGEREFASGPQDERNNTPPEPAPGLSMNVPPSMSDLLKRYGIAMALAGLALLIGAVLPFEEGTAIYPLPIAAVVLSAWYGGRGPGLFASLICIAGNWYWFVPPVNSFAISPDHVLPFSIFIGLCLLLIEFSAGRRRGEQAVRASEERFRTLVQFSFDVYWETDAKHRFTRQEFSERLTDAPARGAEIGKTRWEIPYVEPGEEAWRKHRETMDTHLPFRDFELARPTPEGGKRYVSVSGMPVFDRAGRFIGYRGVGRHISEQKRAEAELRARQEMLDLAQKAAHAVAFDWYIGARENENRWSPELEALYGLEPGTFDRTYQGWKELVHRDDWPAVKLAIQRAHESGDIAAEYRVIHKDGAVHWLRAKGRMFFDADGQPERMVGFMIDVTDLRQAEEEHRAYLWFLESMDRINRAIQGSDELDGMMSAVLKAALDIFACDRAWLVYPCDPKAPSWRAIMEHTRPQFPGAFALQEDLPMDAEVAAVFEAAQAASGPVLFGSSYDLKIPAWAAERFAIRSQIAMAIDAKGDKRHLFGLHQCSHARVWTGEEQRLFQEIGRRLGDAIGALSMLRSVRESERRLEAAQAIAHVGWWDRDLLAGRMSLSDESCRILGVQPVDLPQWRPGRWLSLIHPEDRSAAAAAREAALAGGPRYDMEYRVIRPDGTVRVVHSQGDVMRDESGRPVRQFGVMQDITELRRAEDELSEIRERFRVLAESSLTGIYLTENDRFSYVNPALAKMFGYTVEEIVGRLSSDLTCPDDRTLVAENMRRRLEGEIEEMRYEFRGLRKDGSVFPVEVHGRRIEHGGKIGVLGTLVDNTERKRAEDQLRESEARFRKLTDLSADWYWRQDENLRFILSGEEKVGFAPVALGKTRWELPATPLSASWDEHRAVLAARQPFRDFQYSRIGPEGGMRYVSVSGVPVFDERGAFKGYDGVASDITPRKRAEQALRESEARFRTFVDRATDAFFLMDEQIRVVDVNRQACDSLGWSREELIGMHPREFDVALDEPSIQRLAQRGRAGEIVTFETRHRRKDGTVFPVEVRSGTFEQGGKLFYLALARDISERKLAEESLRQSEAYLTEAQRLSHTGSWAFDVASNCYVYTSEESDRIFGVDPQGEKPTREVIFERIHPEDRSSWKRNLEKSLREKVDTTDQYRVVLPDGTVRHIHTIRHPVVNSAGEVVKLVGTSIDITERKLAEESLRQSEAYLTEAQRLSHTGSWALDVATNRYVYTSEEFDRLFGFDPQAEAPTREAVLERMHPEDRISWKRILEKSVGEKVDTTSQYRIVLPDGRVRHIHTIRHPVVDSTGKVVKLVGSSIDITERKHAEEELRASEARFRTFVDRAADAFFLHDAQLRIVDVNRQACESLGRSREELFGVHPREFDVGLDEASMRRFEKRLAAGEIITFETRHRRKDGTVFPVEIRTGTFQQGGELFYLALARDITERKLAEETLRGKDYALQIARTELAHVSRLTTLGELTTSIVHEVSQPLGAMITSAAAGARWLAAKPPSLSEARVALDNIVADGKRARDVIARIRALTKRQAPRMGLLDLNRKIVEVVSFAEHELRSHDIVLETKLDSELPQVTGDRVQLQQVLLNLIINAIEAMSAVNNRPRELTIVSARGPDGVLVEVRDSGTGLDPERAERVFEAFYTTKAEGIGIGLSISRSIVEAHGGRLSAAPNELHGAVFRFSLPVAQEASS